MLNHYAQRTARNLKFYCSVKMSLATDSVDPTLSVVDRVDQGFPKCGPVDH